MSEQAKNPYEDFLQRLPCDWERLEIRKLGTVAGGGTPSREIPSYWHGDIPWLTPGEVSRTETQLLHGTQEHINHAGLNGSGANLLPPGSLMVTTRATLGARAINAVPMATNQGFKSIIFKDLADGGYYFHLFEKVKPELIRRASGTTFLEISGAEFGSIQVPNPPILEKKLIAQILDTLDTAIRETEALIDKLTAVKQGLLHDLLTRGIDDNGQVRPPQTEAPQLYKESPLGWIPREWNAQLIAALLTDIEAGKSPSCSDTPAPSGSWGVLKVSAVHSDGFRSDQNKLVEHESLVNPAYEVHSGDLLITRANTPELVGMACLVEDPQPKLMLCDKTLRLVVNGDMASKEYLCLCLQQPYIRSQIECSATGTSMSMKNISQHSIRNLLVAIAPLPEQIEISARANTLSLRLKHETAVLEKLKQQKAGLMNDLLTGRVRVTPLLKSIQQTAAQTEA